MANRPHRPAPLPTGTPRILVSGYLTKRTKNFKSWKKRWWQLSTDGMLLYFKNESRCKLLGEIDIGGSCYDVCLGADKVKVSFPATIPANCCFSFSVLKRTYYLYAAAESEAKRWVECVAHVSGVLRRKREVQYKASFRRDPRPPVSDPTDAKVSKRERQLHRHSYTDSVQTDSQEEEDTVMDLPVFGSDKGAMRYSSVPTRLDDLNDSTTDDAQAQLSHASSTIHLQNSAHIATNPKFFTLPYERRSSPSKKISFSSSVGGVPLGEPSPHKAEGGLTVTERPSSAQKGDAFMSYAKNLEQLEKQEAELRKRMKELDSPPPRRSASVLQLGKTKDEYAQAIAMGVPILPSIMKQRSQSDLSNGGAGPPITPKSILRNSGRRKDTPPFAAVTRSLDATAAVPSDSSNAGDIAEDHVHEAAPISPPPPPLPPKPAALPPAPPCPPTPMLPPNPPTPFVNTTSTSTQSPSLVWQTSDYWGLNGTKSSSTRADDASRWAQDEMKKPQKLNNLEKSTQKGRQQSHTEI
eukprot:Em0021g814a